jgi:hypothetical protein
LALSSGASRLRQVGPDREVDDTDTTPKDNQAALSLLLLSLKALSQRTIVALGNLVAFAALGSVWWLFNNALPADPTVHQLIGLGLYGALVLAVLWVREQ